MPAIMIGVGGVGGTIVAEVRRRLEIRVNMRDDTPAAREQAAQYRFFLLDTKEEPFNQDFRLNERFVIPSGIDKFHVDEKIASWHAGDGDGDPFFAEWWPAHNNIPYRVGDFDEGAGQIRIKGKLAYRIHIAQGKDTIVDAVDEAVRSIRSARGISANQDLHKIPVYIVASLGGGTGSGIVLTLAKHLRRSLPSYCVLQGVFLLASIAALAPGRADEASIWANTDAALREIDYFQRPRAYRLNQPNPYLEWPGAGNRIENREAPFAYIYLFGRVNRAELPLDSLDDYTRLVAECLVAETFGPISELIKGPHSQFVARFFETPEVDGRATSYASAGIAGVHYPAERIIQHLGRRFAAKVIAKAFDTSGATPQVQAAQSFLRDRADLWADTPPLRTAFRQALPDGTKMPQRVPLEDPQYWQSPANDIESHVNGKLKRYDAWRDEQLVPFLQRQTRARSAAMLGSQGDLRKFLRTQLGSGPNGVAVAVGTIDALIAEIKEQMRLVRVSLQGDPTKPGTKGQAVQLTERKEKLPQQIKRLPKGYKKLPIGDKTNKEGKAAFLKVWNNFVELDAEVAIADQALIYYDELLRELQAAQAYLNELIAAARRQGRLLDLEAEDDLGTNIKDSVLSVGILDEPVLADHQFRGRMEQVIAEEGDALINELIRGPHGLAGSLDTKLDRRATVKHELIHDDFRDAIAKATSSAGREHFDGPVRGMTIWDAIKHECVARQECNRIDTALEKALTALEKRREVMNRAGTPLVHPEKYLLQQFIQFKLGDCKRRAEAFWQLDHVVQSRYADRSGLLYPLTVLAFDRDSYDDFVAREQLDPGLLQSIAENIGIAPQHLDGPDSMQLYCREGVAPLFFLNETERSLLRERAARISGRNKEIYTDLRLRPVVDPIIDPPVTADERRKYALAVGASLDHIHVNGGTDRIQWARPNEASPSARFQTVFDAMDALADDHSLEGELFTFVNGRLDRLTDRVRADYLAQAIEDAKTFQESADIPEKRWWQQTINIIERRLNNAQFRV